MRKLVLLAVLLCACAGEAGRAPPPYGVYVEAGTQRSVVDDARGRVAEWNAKLGVESLVWSDEPLAAEACGVVVRFHAPWDRPGWQAYTRFVDDCHVEIRLNPNGFWDTTIAHELGHVLGLEDRPELAGQDDVASVMTHGTLWREITAADVEQVRSFWGWP